MKAQSEGRKQGGGGALRSKRKALRQMTLCRGRAMHKRFNEFHPDIRLQGKWLSDIGFRSGQVVDIVCEDRKLTITIAETQRFFLKPE